MQIDDYNQAIALKNKLEAALPFRVRPGKQLMKAIKDKTITPATWLEVDSILYTGDMGGITANIVADQGKEVYSVSLTHVVIDPDHELASEVKAYQKRRTRRLMLQDRGAFAAELLAQKSPRKKAKKRKGFG